MKARSSRTKAPVPAVSVAGMSDTTWFLMARYRGMPLIPIETVCQDFFDHLSTKQLLRMSEQGEIPLPITRIDDSQKTSLSVHVNDLARWYDGRIAMAMASDWKPQKRPVAGTGYLYVIGEADGTGSHVKVGRSVDPEHRLNAFQASAPKRLAILGRWEIPQTVASTLETRCHHALAQHRARKEVYAVPADVACGVVEQIVQEWRAAGEA